MIYIIMDYITNADQTLNPIPLYVSGLNLLTNINMYFSGFSIDLLILILHIFSLEDSFHLALDTGIKDIIITEDFNFNLINNQQPRKVVTLCRQLSLRKTISEPTHFTESSSSLFDLIFASNKIINCSS